MINQAKKQLISASPFAPHNHPGLLAALLIYLILAFSYFFIVPIFEAPDEWTHIGHIKHIATGKGLPVMLPGQGIWGGHQPPLYYAIGAVLVQPFEFTNFEAYLANNTNPHASIGYALDPGNKNVYLHQPDEAFPYRGLSLTVHFLRLYSMLFGLVAIIFTYLTAFELASTVDKTYRPINSSLQVRQRLFPPLVFATMVALFVAAQPMFAFITASVANEPANIGFSAIGLWLTQRYVLYGPTPSWRRAVMLGIVLGLVSLSKMTGLSLGLAVAVAVLQTAIIRRKQPGAAALLWRDCLIVGLLFVAVGGWWYWRNYQLYGDFFQRGLYENYFGDKLKPLGLAEFLHHLSIGEVSFWATFGWLNTAAPEWVYSTYRIISRIGLLGVGVAAIARIIKSRTPHPVSLLLIHLTFPVALAFSLTRLVATEGGLQGRQLLPALGSMAIVIVWGWLTLTPARARPVVLAALTAAVLGLAVWLPYGVVARAYTPRPLLTEADLPPNLTRLELIYNGEMKLIGAEIKADVVRPGERVPVTAYWQAIKPMTTNYSVFVHLIGRNYQNVGQFNTYPGLGLRPTTSLQPGQIVADTYPVQVNADSAAPTRLLVNLGLFDFNQPGRPGIQPVSADGNLASPTVGRLKLVPRQWPPGAGRPPLANFADNIQLINYTLQGCGSTKATCTLTLEWYAQAQPSTDYTVFIQFWHNGEQVAGFDAPPLNNDYPTSLWDAGEVIHDPHTLNPANLPPGEYQILVGLYNLAAGDRLPAYTGAGDTWPDYAVDLGILTFEEP